MGACEGYFSNLHDLQTEASSYLTAVSDGKRDKVSLEKITQLWTKISQLQTEIQSKKFPFEWESQLFNKIRTIREIVSQIEVIDRVSMLSTPPKKENTVEIFPPHLVQFNALMFSKDAEGEQKVMKVCFDPYLFNRPKPDANEGVVVNNPQPQANEKGLLGMVLNIFAFKKQK